jgi:hypothetical protein
MRILLAGLAAGIAMFVWSSIAHLATPLGALGISTLPEKASQSASRFGYRRQGRVLSFRATERPVRLLRRRPAEFWCSIQNVDEHAAAA